jgi:hypothetical protein
MQWQVPGIGSGLPLLHDTGVVAARDTVARSALLPPHL